MILKKLNTIYNSFKKSIFTRLIDTIHSNQMEYVDYLVDIEDIFILQNQLVYIKDSNLIIGDKSWYLNKSGYHTVENNNFFKIDYSMESIYFLKNNELIVFDNNGWNTINCSNNNNYILSKYILGKQSTMFKMPNSAFEINGNLNVLSLQKDFFITFTIANPYKVQSFDFAGNLMWTYNVPEGFAINGMAEVIDKVLFFTATDYPTFNRLLTGLNIENGNLLWQVTNPITQLNRCLVLYSVNKKDNLLYRFGKIYEVINPKTGKIIYEKDLEETSKYDLVPHVNSIYDNKLWFVSSNYDKNMIARVKFGYINLENQQMELLQDFNCPNPNELKFDLPIYHKEKLYLRGASYNNLYIFKKV